ncbi:MAG: hypothetical protein ACLFU8_09875 [Anaerolineales bacterium]
MDKGVGFYRTLTLPWLDAAATFVGESDDAAALRARLEPIVAPHIEGRVPRRKTIDLLVNIWLRTGEVSPTLHATAVEWNRTTMEPGDRLWLHYGLTLLYYPFFRDSVEALGQLGRFEDAITTAMVQERMVAEMGALGSLPRALRHLVASLRAWGILEPAEGARYAYRPQRRAFGAGDVALEAWLLACALRAHPAEELPFADLLRLPELFPFRFTLVVDDLRRHPWFAVQRQGAGWEMVRLQLEKGQST